MRRLHAALLCAVLFASRPVAATSFVRMDDAALVAASVAAVRGVVTDIRSAEDDVGSVYTYVTVRADESYFGALPSTFTLRELGGRFGDNGMVVFGSPDYTTGEPVLVFVERVPDGTLRTTGLTMGKFGLREGADGAVDAVQYFGDGVSVLDLRRRRFTTPEPSESRPLAELEAGIRAAAAQRGGGAVEPVVATPQEMLDGTEMQVEAAFNTFSPAARWFEGDSGGTVTYCVDPTAASGIGQPATNNAASAALAAWTDDAEATLTLANGGACPALGSCSGTNPYSQCPSHNWIVFNDPCNGVGGNPSGCSGTLGMGGYSYTLGQQITLDKVYYRITRGYVAMNDGWSGCWDACLLAESLAHEVGHSIGFAHSADSNALMYAQAHDDGRCASLSADDVRGVRTIYPNLGPTSTRTPTRTATNTLSPSITPTITNTLPPTSTFTQTATRTASFTRTVSPTPSITPTRTSTRTASFTFTPSPTRTVTNTATATRSPTITNTPLPTSTATESRTSTRTPTISPTFTVTATRTVTFTRTATRTPTLTNTPVPTSTATPSRTPSSTPTRTPSRTATFTPTFTPTRTPTRTLTSTPTPGIEISGAVRHFATSAAVDGVTVHLSETSTDLTDPAGAYAFENLPLTGWEVEPRKTGGVNGAIGALDAALALEAALNPSVLGAHAALACDVTGDGSVGSLDASRILQLLVGRIARLPVASSCGSDWAFDPQPAVAANQTVVEPGTSPDCTAGAVSYSPLAGSAIGQDFVAIPFGDCTGNWQPSGALTVREPSSAEIRLGSMRPGRGRRVRVPVSVVSRDPMRGIEVEVAWNGSRLRAPRVVVGEGAGGAVLAWARVRPDRMRVALAHPRGMAGGTLFEIELRPRAGASVSVDDLQVVGGSVDEAPIIRSTRRRR